MSNNLNSLKTRLNSVKSTKKLTNAMMLVSSARERKLNSLFKETSDFYLRLETSFDNSIFLNKVNEDADNYSSPFLLKNEGVNKRLLIVVTSNNGLCTGYNNNVIKFLKDNYKNGDEILLLGEKGKRELENEKVTYFDDFIYALKDFNLFGINKIAQYIKEKYKNKEYSEIDLIYTHYVNPLISKVNIETLLPLKIKENKERNYSPIYEPSKEEFLDKLIEEMLNAKLYYYLEDSLIAEESFRRNAMDNASKNADDLIDQLNLEYNKVRQTNITTEITEIIAGSKNVK